MTKDEILQKMRKMRRWKRLKTWKITMYYSI